ncbi:MAG: bifunctional 3-(3-hydroxy-phenyl)propionate/3-hydroxycinnamic acid hydroxylase [Alphaproteobacteria bacterium]
MLYDVAVIGYGPTGATLGNLLAAQGVSVLVIDREAEMYPLPRAVHFDDEVMRVFQTVGIAEDLQEKVYINPGMKFVDEDQNLLLDWPRPQEITVHGWNASYRLHQPDLETLLRDRLEQEASAEIMTCFDVTSIQEHEDHVTLSGTTQGGKTEIFKARYLVGCDGANSLTRQVIGGEMDDLGFEERWLVVDALLKRSRPDLGDHTMQFCTPDRPMTYCRNPGDRRRWEMTIKDEETDAEIREPARVWDLLSRWITPDDAELERRAVYTFRSQVATRWRSGRLLIAGDAAHLTPPFMGQGMCTGIRDAANLAWKLIACLNGADEALLDTYPAERAPHARAYVETATRLGRLINTLDRDSALKMAEGQNNGASQMRSITPELGASMICATDAHDCVGRPFGQVDLGQGQRGFDQLIGYSHAVISPVEPTRMPRGTRWLDPSQHPSLSQALSDLGTRAIWIRPDRYIGAVSDSGSGLLDQLNPFFDSHQDAKENETCLT